MSRSPVSWGFAILPGLFLLFWYLLTFPGTIAPHISDGRSMYLVTQALVDRHDVALRDPLEPSLISGWHLPKNQPGACATEPAVIGVGTRPGGPIFSKFGIGQSLAVLPLYVLGEKVTPLFPLAFQPDVAPFVSSSYNSIVTAATAVLLCALGMRLGWSRKVALVLTLAFGVCTPAWAYTTTFFSEPTIAFCVLAAVATVLWNDESVTLRSAGLTGLWLGSAVLVRLDSAAYIPLFALFLILADSDHAGLFIRPGWRSLLAVLAIAPAAALLLIAAYNWARFGNPASSGYGIAGDYHDLHPPHSLKALWEGVYGPLLSPGKGLFLYAPVFLLLPWAVARCGRGGCRRVALLSLGIVAIAVLTHANTLIVWLGGWAWGPRFMVPIIPVLLLPIGALLHEGGRTVRRWTWCLAVLGFVIQIPAVLLDRSAYIRYLARTNCIWHVEDLYKWHPQYTPLLGQWGRLLDPASYADQGLMVQEQLSGLRKSLDIPSLSVQQFMAAGRFTAAPQAWWRLLALQGVTWQSMIVPLGCLLIGASIALCFALRLSARTPVVG